MFDYKKALAASTEMTRQTIVKVYQRHVDKIKNGVHPPIRIMNQDGTTETLKTGERN